jgi:hypothetical protein
VIDSEALLVISLFVAFVGIIYLIDWLRLELGYRVEPAPWYGGETPATVNEYVMQQADKKMEQDGEPK